MVILDARVLLANPNPQMINCRNDFCNFSRVVVDQSDSYRRSRGTQ